MAPRDPRVRVAVRSLAQRTDHTIIESLDAVLLPLTDLGLGGKKMVSLSYPPPTEDRGWCHILTMSGPTLRVRRSWLLRKVPLQILHWCCQMMDVRGSTRRELCLDV
jgi:hypothetical protein